MSSTNQQTDRMARVTCRECASHTAEMICKSIEELLQNLISIVRTESLCAAGSPSPTDLEAVAIDALGRATARRVVASYSRVRGRRPTPVELSNIADLYKVRFLLHLRSEQERLQATGEW